MLPHFPPSPSFMLPLDLLYSLFYLCFSVITYPSTSQTSLFVSILYRHVATNCLFSRIGLHIHDAHVCCKPRNKKWNAAVIYMYQQHYITATTAIVSFCHKRLRGVLQVRSISKIWIHFNVRTVIVQGLMDPMSLIETQDISRWP